MIMRRNMNALAPALALLAAASALSAQSVASRVSRVRDGTVRMSFTARPGVCGNGSSFVSTRRGEYIGSRGGEWENDCESGPVRVSMSVEGGEVRALRTYVGGRWREVNAASTDLGMIAASDAAAFLVNLARTSAGRAARDAIFPATLADSATIWPGLLQLAKDTSRPRDARRQAIFWLGQAAGDQATGMLDSVATDSNGDRDVREQAVFALSQRPRDEGIPALVRIVKTSHDREVRKKALFWLGQSEDPRALALIEELILKK